MSGIYGNAGQANYGAAKAGIAAFTNIVALEVARYGVTVNAVGPVALTRMTEGLGPAPETDEAREARAPHWIAPIVTWLCSEEAAGVTGRVFEASGQTLAVAEGWVRGPSTAPSTTRRARPGRRRPARQGPANSGMDGAPVPGPRPPSVLTTSCSNLRPECASCSRIRRPLDPHHTMEEITCH